MINFVMSVNIYAEKKKKNKTEEWSWNYYGYPVIDSI